MTFVKYFPTLESYILFIFVSPEERCKYLLDDCLKNMEPNRVVIIDFQDYGTDCPCDAEDKDREAFEAYQRNLTRIKEIIERHSISYKLLPCWLNYIDQFIAGLKKELDAQMDHIIFDISCAPRGNLICSLKLLFAYRSNSNKKVFLGYTIMKRQAKEESFFSAGLRDVVVVPGYPGIIRQRPDLLIIILGFEGNRAMGLYRRILPKKTILIIGNTGGPDRDYYFMTAKKNNHSLIHIHGNRLLTMPSRSPKDFLYALRLFYEQEIISLAERYNIYITCLGTKAQAVGLYMFLEGHPELQLLTSLPSHRRISSYGKPDRILYTDIINYVRDM